MDNINRAYLKTQEKQINRLKDILFPKNKYKNTQENIKFYHDDQDNDNESTSYKNYDGKNAIKSKLYHTSVLEVNANSVQYLSPHSQIIDFEESEEKKIIKNQILQLKQQIDSMLKKWPNQSANSWLYQTQNLQNYPNTQQSQQDQISQTQRHYLSSINKLNQALQKYNQYVYGIEQAAQELNDNLNVQRFYNKNQLEMRNKVKYYLTSMICKLLVHKIEICFKKRVKNAFDFINDLFESKKTEQKNANSIQKILQQTYKKKSLQLMYKGFSRWRQVSSLLYYKQKQQLKRQTQMPWKNQPQNFILKNMLFVEKLVLYFQAKLNQNHFKCQILIRKQKQQNFTLNTSSDKEEDVLIGFIYAQGQQGSQNVNINDYENVLESISARSAISNFSYAKNIKQYELSFRSSNSLTKLAMDYKKIIKIEKTEKNTQFSLIDKSITNQIQYKLINTQRQSKQQPNFSNVNKLECSSQSSCIFYPILVQDKIIGIIRQYFESKSFSSVRQVSSQSIRYIGETLNNSICLTKKLKQIKQEKYYIQNRYHLKAIKVIQSLQASKYQDLFQNLSKNFRPIFNFQYFAQFRLQKRNNAKDLQFSSQARQKFILSKQQQIFNIQEDESLSQYIKKKILFVAQKMKKKEISHFVMKMQQEINENDKNRANVFTNVEQLAQKNTQRILLYIKIGLNLYSFVISSVTDKKANVQQNDKLLPLQIITDVLLKYEQIKQLKEKQFKKQEMIKIQQIKSKYESKVQQIQDQMQKQLIEIYSSTNIEGIYSMNNQNDQIQNSIVNKNANFNICWHIDKLFKTFSKGISSLFDIKHQILPKNKFFSNKTQTYQLSIQIYIKSLKNNKYQSISSSSEKRINQLDNISVYLQLKPQSYKILSVKTQPQERFQNKEPLLLYSSIDFLQRIKQHQTSYSKSLMQVSLQILCEKESMQQFIGSKKEQFNQDSNESVNQLQQNQQISQFQKIQSQKLQDIFKRIFKEYFDCYYLNSFKSYSDISSNGDADNRKKKLITQNQQEMQSISTFQSLKQKIVKLASQFLEFQRYQLSQRQMDKKVDIQFLIKDQKQLSQINKKNQQLNQQSKDSKYRYVLLLQKSSCKLCMEFCPTLTFRDDAIERLIINMGLKNLLMQKKCEQDKTYSKNQQHKTLPSFIIKLNNKPILKLTFPKNIFPSELNHQVNNDFLIRISKIIEKYQQQQQITHKVKLLQQFDKIKTLYTRKQIQIFSLVFGKIKTKSHKIKNKIDTIFNLNKLLKIFNSRIQQQTISHWKKNISMILFEFNSQQLKDNLENPLGYKYQNIKQLVKIIMRLSCKKVKQLFLIHQKSTKGKFRSLVDQKICQVFDNRLKLHLQIGLISIKNESKQRLRLKKLFIYESEQKTRILKQVINRIINSIMLSSFNFIKKHKVDSIEQFFQNQTELIDQNNLSNQSLSLQKLQLLLNKCKNMKEMHSLLQSVQDLKDIQIWMRIGKKNENYLSIKNRQYFHQNKQNQENSNIYSNKQWMTLKKDQLLNIQQRFIMYESPNQVLFIIKKQTYESFEFKQKDYLNQLSKTFRQYFTHFKHDLKCKISLNQELLKYMNKLTLKQSFKNWRNIAQQCLKIQKYKMNDKIYEVCAEMENIKEKIKFQQKQKEETIKQYKKLTLKQEQINIRIQKYASFISKIQAQINQHKQKNLGLSQQRKIMLQQSLLKWRQVNLVQKIHQKKIRSQTKSLSLLIKIISRVWKNEQRKAMRQGVNRICGFVIQLKQKQKIQKLNQRSLANQLQQQYQQLNARLMTFQKNHFNTESINQNDDLQEEVQNQNHRNMMDKEYWYQTSVMNLKPNLFQSQSASDLKQYDQYQNSYYNSKENQHFSNNKESEMQSYEEYQNQKTSQSYRKNGTCLQIPLVINRLKMNQPTLNKENVDVTLEQQNRINKGIYKLNGKTLRFLKRMGKINQSI